MATPTLSGPGVELEQTHVFTTLGIQFWDFALDQPVDNGLAVEARRPATQYAPTQAFRTLSGVYAFQGLPGLHAVEYPPAGANPPFDSPPTTLNFVITVEDRLGRFLPTLFGVDLPLPYRGLFLSNGVGSPAGVDARAYLFSAPIRQVAVGMSAVRVTLWDIDRGQPAKYAALRVTVDGQVWTGIADEEGRALVPFPSPVVRRLSLGSPPGSGQGSPSGMTWPVSVQVLYEPNQLRLLLENTPDVQWPWNITPSLKSILDGQRSALIWQSQAGPPVTDWMGTLTYGEDLFLRTTSTDPTVLSSVLSISQGITSP